MGQEKLDTITINPDDNVGIEPSPVDSLPDSDISCKDRLLEVLTSSDLNCPDPLLDEIEGAFVLLDGRGDVSLLEDLLTRYPWLEEPDPRLSVGFYSKGGVTFLQQARRRLEIRKKVQNMTAEAPKPTRRKKREYDV